MSGEHEPGCLGNHLGDCAVSGYFDTARHGRDSETLCALRALLLHPPAGSSDAEVLAAARALLRMTERTSPGGT